MLEKINDFSAENAINLTSKDLQEIEQSCDDTCGFLVKTSTLAYIIEKYSRRSIVRYFEDLEKNNE